jgi:hypothetical protein
MKIDSEELDVKSKGAVIVERNKGPQHPPNPIQVSGNFF